MENKSVSVYDFKSYKAYLKAWIHSRPGRGRGEKRRLAERSGCFSAYVSRVLEHSAHFSLEQASAISDYLGHNKLEARFFILLVEYERAGTNGLRQHFLSQIEEILERRISLQHAAENKKGISLEDQAIYYSSWHFAAVHLLVMIPNFQTNEAIARRMKIPRKRLAEVLEFLVSRGLVNPRGDRYVYGDVQLFLPQASPLSSKLHTNWRMKAIESLDNEQPHDLHFSSVGTIREADLAKVRDSFMKAIAEARKITKDSTEEDTLFCYSIDLFRP